jgi:hypothetical protein
MGYAVMLGFLQLWHLVAPVNWLCTLLFCGAGVIAGHRCGAYGLRAWSAPSRGTFVLVFFVVGWLALRALGAAGNYDSGLYHFASVRWSNEYSIVPGLANLHDRLAFNQSHLLFVALANVFPFDGHGHHVANSLLCVVLASSLAHATVRLWHNPTPQISGLVSAFLLPALIWRITDWDISSPAPDLPIYVLALVVFLRLIRLAEADATNNQTSSVALLVFLCAAGVSVKLSFVGYALAVCAMLPYLTHCPRRRDAPPNGLRTWLVLVFSALLFWGMPYGIRSIILSGYPLFPMPLGALPFDWTLPVEEARHTRDSIASWSRAPGLLPQDVLGNWKWLPAWWEQILLRPHLFGPVLFAAAGVVAIALHSLRMDRTDSRNRKVVICGAATLATGLGFWFFTAPDIRFGDWLLWPCAALGAALLLSPKSSPSVHPKPPRLILVCVIVFSTLICLVQARIIFVWPQGFTPIRMARTQPYESEHGVVILVPTNSDDRLWSSPLPSTPYARPNLSRRGDSLSDGFRSLPKSSTDALINESPASPR